MEDQKDNQSSSELRQKIRDFRVSQEIIDLANQCLAGDIKKFIFRILFYVLSTWALIMGLHYLLNAFLPGKECVRTCFIQHSIKCCAGEFWFAARIVLYLVLLFLTSFTSTHFTRRGKFQHSATTSAVIILVAIIVQNGLPIPGIVTALFIFLAFVVMFYGYKLAIRLQ
jgi:hypothetical protein